jgi:hypothetical protein
MRPETLVGILEQPEILVSEIRTGLRTLRS